MRTKRVLSIIMATLLTLGMFAIAASAVDYGWQGNVSIIEDTSLAGNMGEAVVIWEPFRHTDGTVSGANSFNTLYNNGKKANFTWSAWKVDGDGLNVYTDPVTNATASVIGTKGLTIVSNWLLASVGDGVYWNLTNTQLQLIMKQPSVNYFGWVKVELKITLDGTVYNDAIQGDDKKIEVTSAAIWVELKNPSKLAEAIKKAEAELAKTDRYTSSYLDNLKNVINAAKSIVNSKPDAEITQDYINYLEDAINGKRPNGSSVGYRWKLASNDGKGFIDETILNQTLIENLWTIIDTVMILVDAVKNFFDFFSQVLKAVMFVVNPIINVVKFIVNVLSPFIPFAPAEA